MINLKVIKDLCRNRGISLEDLAQRTSISLRTIHRSIRENTTKIETLEKIASALNVSPSVFFSAPPVNEDSEKELKTAIDNAPKEMLPVKLVFDVINKYKQLQISYSKERAYKDLYESIIVELENYGLFSRFISSMTPIELRYYRKVLLMAIDFFIADQPDPNIDISKLDWQKNVVNRFYESDDNEMWNLWNERLNSRKEAQCKSLLKNVAVQILFLNGKISDPVLKSFWKKYQSDEENQNA